MLQRFGRGWGIAKASWSIIRLHPKLLFLPILSGIALLALLALIGSTVFAGAKTDYVRHLMENAQPDQAVTYAILFAVYFVCTLVFIFFNSALVFCTLQSFNGQTPSIRSGLATAARRLPQILAWTLVATTVGLALNVLQSLLKDKLGFLGALLGGLFEGAWAIVTYFVVPLLVVEGATPITAVKRSSAIMRRTWGETASGEGGLGAIFILLFLPVIVVVGLVGFMGINLHAVPVALAMFGGAIAFYVAALVVVFTALGTIFQTGIYVFATTGKAPSSMDQALLQGAFSKKL